MFSIFSLTHFDSANTPRLLGSFDYTLGADGRRDSVAEELRQPGVPGGSPDPVTETHGISYTYDNLNRLLTEQAADGASHGYNIEYKYDVVGNRLERKLTVNTTQKVKTAYTYNAQNDRLESEENTTFSLLIPGHDDRPIYAYVSNGGITHYRLYESSKDISPFKAYLLFGIPTKWADYAITTVLGLLPITFLLPVFTRIIRRGERRAMPLFRQCLIVFLTYLMLLNPSWVEQDAQASIDYSNLSRNNWGTVNRDIHYYYDANGSCIKKIEAVKDTANPDTTFINKTLYTYDIRNQLIKVEYTTNGTTWDTTTYKYNDDGIRVEKNDNGTITTYLVDSHNHTGYAQVLEERTGGALTKTYIIGDNVIGEVNNSNTLKYYLYDGQDSVRHHSNSSGDLVSYGSCDTFAYDAYGQRVDPLQNTPGVKDGLFYTGEMYDSKAKMYYLRARYYDPLNGRFNQLDPYAGNNEDPQSLHKYLYAHCDPINNSDPLGLFSLSEINISMVINTAMRAWTGYSIFTTVKKAYQEGIGSLTFFDWLFLGLDVLHVSSALSWIQMTTTWKKQAALFHGLGERLAEAVGRARGSIAGQLGTQMHEALKSSWLGRAVAFLEQRLAGFGVEIFIDKSIGKGKGSRPDITIVLHKLKLGVAFDMKAVPRATFYSGILPSYQWLYEQSGIREQREGTIGIIGAKGYACLYFYIPYPSFVL